MGKAKEGVSGTESSLVARHMRTTSLSCQRAIEHTTVPCQPSWLSAALMTRAGMSHVSIMDTVDATGVETTVTLHKARLQPRNIIVITALVK